MSEYSEWTHDYSTGERDIEDEIGDLIDNDDSDSYQDCDYGDGGCDTD